MAILKRYICSKHGEFDGWSEASIRCPAAKCRCKPREMVSAPAVHTSGSTKQADKTLDQLAMDFKMTNIKSTKEGDNQSGYFTRNNTEKPRQETGVRWGDQGALSMKSITAGGRFRSVRDEPVGVKVAGGGAPKLRPSSVIHDHENLKIQR